MKIYVLGSSHFKEHMVECAEGLCTLGHDGWIHQHYIDFVKGKHQDIQERWKKDDPTERANIKRENNYLHDHYKHILESDAVLIVNDEKNGIPNYIGGNVLIEMGQAFVNGKKIFFLNGMPAGMAYQAEIECMDPICLNGDLGNISLYERQNAPVLV